MKWKNKNANQMNEDKNYNKSKVQIMEEVIIPENSCSFSRLIRYIAGMTESPFSTDSDSDSDSS